jgi:heme exporter protein D
MVTGESVASHARPGVIITNLHGAMDRMSILAKVENESARDARLLARLRAELGLIEVKE